MKIVITGGGGFIGSKLAKALLAHNRSASTRMPRMISGIARALQLLNESEKGSSFLLEHDLFR